MGNVYGEGLIFPKDRASGARFTNPRKIILTAGNVNDCDVACELLDNFNLQGKTIIADRGYSTFVIKNFIETCSALCCISLKSNFKNSWDYDREKIERFFGQREQP